jgi:hypothetical protein
MDGWMGGWKDIGRRLNHDYQARCSLWSVAFAVQGDHSLELALFVSHVYIVSGDVEFGHGRHGRGGEGKGKGGSKLVAAAVAAVDRGMGLGMGMGVCYVEDQLLTLSQSV